MNKKQLHLNNGALLLAASSLSVTSSNTNGTIASSSSASSATKKNKPTTLMGGKLKTKAVSFKAKLRSKLKKVKSISSSTSSGSCSSSGNESSKKYQAANNLLNSQCSFFGIETIDENTQANFETMNSQEMSQEEEMMSQEEDEMMSQNENIKKLLAKCKKDEELRTFLSTFTRLMDKSLNWFRIRSAAKSSSKRNECASSFDSSKQIKLNLKIDAKMSNDEAFLIQSPHHQQLVEEQLNDDIEFDEEEEEDEDQKCLNYSTSTRKRPQRKSSYLLSNILPAMSSSFELFDNEKKLMKHSTPTRTTVQQFSPIFSHSSDHNSLYSSSSSSSSDCSSSTCSPTKNSYSYEDESFVPSLMLPLTPSFSSSSSDNKSSSLLISKLLSPSRKRLSFGVTSSPKSSIFSRHLLSDDFNDGHLSEAVESDFFLDYKQKRLLDQLNLIKESVKIGYESSSRAAEQTSRELDQHDGERITSSKRKKLRKIFQFKLQKQLDEIKKWQVGIKSDVDATRRKRTTKRRGGDLERRAKQPLKQKKSSKSQICAEEEMLFK